MTNVKNITDLPIAESTEGLNLIVNDNGAAKQIAADKVGSVKSVNGATPDINGNVEIEIPEGFSGSWNDLKDKPFYEEVKEVTLLATVDGPCIELDGFPNLEVGDTISLIIDNIEYTLTAFDDYGYPAIGDSWDDFDNGSGNYGWNITQGNSGSWFFESKKPTSITYKANLITQIDEQYLPSVYKHIKFNFGEKKLTSHTYNEIYQMVINDIPLIAVDEDNLINKYYLPEYYNSAIRFKRIRVSNNQLKYYELCISEDDSITTNTYFVNLSN